MNDQVRVIAIPRAIATISPNWDKVEILETHERLTEILRSPLSTQDAIVHAAFAKHILELNSKIAALEKRLDKATKFPDRADSEVSGD